jgi:TRAP-type C4-dicarboxylate transport system substrate-binding protein
MYRRNRHLIKLMRGFTLGLSMMMVASNVYAAQVLKIATIAPEGSSWMKLMHDGAEEIKIKTKGRVVMKFYTGGVMGNEKSVLRKIRVRQLQGGAFTAGSLSDVYPDMNLYSLPMVFRSDEELDYVRSRMDDVLVKGLGKAGFVSFGFAGGGFAQVMSSVPIRTLDDLKGKRIWVPEGDLIGYTLMESLGLSPVTLPVTDVMTGLEAGLIEVVATSPIGAIAFQWHTRLKYITETRLVYLYATLAIDNKVFSRLRPDDQSTVRDVMSRTYTVMNKMNREDNIAAERALIDQGLTLVRQSKEEMDSWHKSAKLSIEKLLNKGTVSRDLFDVMQNYLEEFRSRKRTGKTGSTK